MRWFKRTAKSQLFKVIFSFDINSLIVYDGGEKKQIGLLTKEHFPAGAVKRIKIMLSQ